MIVYHSDVDLAGFLLQFEHRRDSGERVRLFLAEGDSWFSVGGATTNLLMALDDSNTLIVSCARPGDTMRNMADMGNRAFLDLLRPNFGVKWDGVLLSAGGNDLLGDVGLLIEGGNLSHEGLRIALDGVALGYRRIVGAVRDHHACRIHAHTYDYPVSDPWGGRGRLGPWIGNRLLAAGVAPRRHDAIITDIVDALADTIDGIADLTVHDTRGLLTPRPWRRWGWQACWRNEMHPTRAGYAQLAARWRL